MKELSLNQMEMVSGGGAGSCAIAIAEGQVAIWSLAGAMASTGVLAPFSIGLAIASIGFLAYNVYRNGDPCM
jgi:UDP-N-acetylmuramyl pentapeptide phosphotransferase/UDP-N-acetylglucosamine-1-phosphate transferase